MIPPDVEREILRLHHVEKWRPGTIARSLAVHFVTVKRVIEREGDGGEPVTRSSKVDPYLPFILNTLERFPKLTAARLYEMVRERGYPGKPSHFRAIIAKVRPQRPTEAYLRLRCTSGDQGQVDWGHFGTIEIGRAQRPLMAFVLVLSYSRAIFLRFFPSQHMSFFLQGHQEALQRFGGCPRNLLYDNLKSVVTSRPGSQYIDFNQDFSGFAAHYRFRPIPVAVRRGNEKGRVERAIRYVRSSFFAGRSFKDLSDLNEQADRWATGVAMERQWPDDQRLTVAEAYANEQPTLLPLRDVLFPCEERREVRVGKTPYVRFDRNDYSVPHNYVRQLVVVLADLANVRILSGDIVIAMHPRSFDHHRTIEDSLHIERLVQDKRRAARARNTDAVLRSVPSSHHFLERAIEDNLGAGAVVRQLRDLLASYGARALERAVQEALARGVSNPHGVRHILEAERIRDGEPAALPLDLPADERLNNLHVEPHSLDGYDGLTNEEEEEENNDDKH